MHLDLALVAGSAVVGFLVGLTGMGGGALMTPMLVILFNVAPAAAISSDLVAALFMKPLGVAIHWHRQTVNRALVRFLSYGSVPGALLGSYTLHLLGGAKLTQVHIQVFLGLALLVGAAAMVGRLVFPTRHAATASITVHRGLTMAVGLVGGFMVGLTSVGAGSLVLVLLTMIYPTLRSDVLVGTDLAQSLPLTAAATLGALLFGKVSLTLTTAIIIGALPAVVAGALISSRVLSVGLRPFIAGVALLSGLKYVGLPVRGVGVAAVLVAVAATALSVRAVRALRASSDTEAVHDVVTLLPTGLDGDL